MTASSADRLAPFEAAPLIQTIAWVWKSLLIRDTTRNTTQQ